VNKRERVRAKFGGLCAYSGQPLGDDWQIDHITPVLNYQLGLAQGNPHDIDNLIPVLRILNHYKRSNNLVSWRLYMSTFHIRLGKLPKNPRVEKTKKRVEYMNKVAAAFGIAPDKPFSGVFYFETLITTEEVNKRLKG